jgi:hypothetical protein
MTELCVPSEQFRTSFNLEARGADDFFRHLASITLQQPGERSAPGEGASYPNLFLFMNTFAVIRLGGAFAPSLIRKGFILTVLAGTVGVRGQVVTGHNQGFGAAGPFESISSARLFNFSSTFARPEIAFFSPSQPLELAGDPLSAESPLQLSEIETNTQSSRDENEANVNLPASAPRESLPSFFSAHSFSSSETMPAADAAKKEIKPSTPFLITLR